MKFLLTLTIVFVVFTVPLYIFVQKNLVTPDKSLVAIAQNIPRYPNASSWEINTAKKFCIDKLSKCGNSADITFTTSDSWNIIYDYYRSSMGNDRWGTNSTIFTTMPTSIIFIRDNCEADLAPAHKLFGGNEKQKYTLQISCDSTQPIL